VKRRRKGKEVLDLVSFTENEKVLSRKITKVSHVSRERGTAVADPDLELRWGGRGRGRGFLPA